MFRLLAKCFHRLLEFLPLRVRVLLQRVLSIYWNKMKPIFVSFSSLNHNVRLTLYWAGVDVCFKVKHNSCKDRRRGRKKRVCNGNSKLRTLSILWVFIIVLSVPIYYRVSLKVRGRSNATRISALCSTPTPSAPPSHVLLAVNSSSSIKNHRGHLHQMLARIIRRVAQGEVLTQRGELCTNPTCQGIRISMGLLSWKQECWASLKQMKLNKTKAIYQCRSHSMCHSYPGLLSIPPFIHGSAISLHKANLMDESGRAVWLK